MNVFADTFYWIAVTNRRDSAHERVLRLMRSIGQVHITTSEPVLIEYLNFFASRQSSLRIAAARNVRAIEASASVRVLPSSGDFFERGLSL